MTPSHPDHQRFTRHRLDEDAAMDTFTVRLPRWRSCGCLAAIRWYAQAIGSRHWLWCSPW